MGHPDLAPPNMMTGLPTEMTMKERKRHHSKKARKQSKKDSLGRRLGHHQMSLAASPMPTGPEFGTVGLSSDDDFLSSVTSGHSDLDTEDEQEGYFAFRSVGSLDSRAALNNIPKQSANFKTSNQNYVSLLLDERRTVST